MSTLADATHDVVARLLSAGIRATDDERDVNPPAVFVPAPALTYSFGRRRFDAVWELIAVVPDAGRHPNLIALGELINQVQDALDGSCTSARPVSFAGVDQAPPLPGYALTYHETHDQ